ncbi:fatty acyl-CoA reductase 1-like [Parasteatoda tepidariorum]|uniref:fatty acyl-CoA reductase 1-like n=1 Tax=Parasteatoda tepidariorum TaxID=114398 RepID=UPI001C71E049|nr:fatty acyl-CoA reductase 1-like [Parasteatoda tepidariorum]
MHVSQLFHRLLEENPSAAEKVIAVHGDVSQPNLGMSDKDYAKVTEEVTIVFHIAAVVSFTKPLRYMANQNSVSVKHVIEFARKLKKLEALVCTSTAFSNSNQHEKIEETIYRLPWTGERFLKALE